MVVCVGCVCCEAGEVEGADDAVEFGCDCDDVAGGDVAGAVWLGAVLLGAVCVCCALDAVVVGTTGAGLAVVGNVVVGITGGIVLPPEATGCTLLGLAWAPVDRAVGSEELAPPPQEANVPIAGKARMVFWMNRRRDCCTVDSRMMVAMGDGPLAGPAFQSP